MNAKQKAAAPKEKWQAIRRRYSWHLRPPFNDTFDHSHWWKGEDLQKIEPFAALYELARRHPLAKAEPKQVYLPNVKNTAALPAVLEPVLSLSFIRRHGIKSWLKLNPLERNQWKASVKKMKGVDSRPQSELCKNLTLAAYSLVNQRHQAEMKQAAETTGPIGGFGWLAAPPKSTSPEMESAISQCSIEAHGQGFVLLAVAPDLNAEKAKIILPKLYGEHKRSSILFHKNQRGRWKDWLPLIESFEDSENSHKAYAQEFARYKRALDGFHFA